MTESAEEVARSEASEGFQRRISIAEAAVLTGISKKALRSRADRGSLASVLEDGVRKVAVADLKQAGLLEPPGSGGPGRAPREQRGEMVVPISDWQRLMDQVSNVFEISRELADTSARAARAETQSEFFRDRFQEERTRAHELEQQLTELRQRPPAPERRRWFRRRQ